MAGCRLLRWLTDSSYVLGALDCEHRGTDSDPPVCCLVLLVAHVQVLHMDRNEYYGGECASLNLKQVRSVRQRRKEEESTGCHIPHLRQPLASRLVTDLGGVWCLMYDEL